MLVSQLRNAVALAKTASTARGTLPITACVLIERRDGGTRVACTSIQQSRTVQISEDWPHGRLVVDAKTLADQLASLPDGELQISETASGITLRSSTGPRKFTLATQDASAFPAIERFEERLTLRLDGKRLGALIKRVLPAASQDWTRPFLNAVQLELEPGKITAITTDCHRVIASEIAVEHQLTDKILVPLAGAQLLAGCVAEEAKLLWDDRHIALVADDDTITIARTEAVFPPWRYMIPKHERSHTVPRTEFMESLRVMGQFRTKQEDTSVTMEFGDDQLLLSAASPDTATSANDMVTCTTYGSRKPVRIGARSHYMLDALAAIDADNLDMHVAGELDLILIVGGSTRALVMPVRL